MSFSHGQPNIRQVVCIGVPIIKSPQEVHKEHWRNKITPSIDRLGLRTAEQAVVCIHYINW